MSRAYRILLYIFVFSGLFHQIINAQEADSLLFSQDTIKNVNPYQVMLRSALIPGTGQIAQERLWEAAFFYGLTVTYYYRAAYHFHRFNVTGNKAPLNKARSDLSIAVFTHLLNIADAYDSAFNEKTPGWQGALFSDTPIKSPWGASLRSAFFPGWGQFYNESYVKSVFYFGLVSVVGYQVHWFSEKYNETGLEKYKDNRSRYSWYLGLTYLLMLMDAHVDANLYKFDEAIKLAVVPDLYTKNLLINIQVPF
ncbi:MAG: hypothetical protein H6627_01000 [Calditrichae bacterium]|nr:hypothetical protein [Calditrichia bacterium]